jgi:N4-(beta-N-acetylglucosaminyl)-L-asparaginase
VVGAHTVVELMRQGRTPEQACHEALKRVIDLYRGNPPGLSFYALNKKGQWSGATIYKGAKFCLHDGVQSYQLSCSWLLEKKPE